MNNKNYIAFFTKFTIVAFSLFLISCASSIKTIHNDFEGYTINRMSGGNNLSGGIPVIGARIDLYAQRFESRYGDVVYSLIVHYADIS